MKLYREGKLTGIQSLYCSTAHIANEKFESSVILFMCSPSNNEEVVKEYGQNLIYHLGPFFHSNSLDYKGLQRDKLDHKKILDDYYYSMDVEIIRMPPEEPKIDLANDDEESALDQLKKMSLKSPR